MIRNLTIATVMTLLSYTSSMGQDTLYVNETTTLHLQCASDIIYCDLGSNAIVAAAAPSVPSLLRIKASAPFQGETTLTVMTKDENLTTYIVRYTPHLKKYIIRQKEGQKHDVTSSDATIPSGGNSVIVAINGSKASLNHIYDKTLRIEFNIDNIYTCHNKVYITVGIKNKSSISYSCDVTFVMADITQSRSTAQDIVLVPDERYGHLSVAPGNRTTATYAFEKLTISEGKQLQVNIYETDGYRNVSLKIDSKDIANAKKYTIQ
ncbi:MAG: DUF4138 domain-containing protein [Bacteroidales bacterium]|nr:DUF4138 domain-containing protein [Bacteroidales bacterium]